RERRATDHRPVHLGRPCEVGAAERPGAAAPARLRGRRSGALERAPRAVPAALRLAEHGRGVSVDAGTVLPHPAPAGAARRPAAAGADAAEEPPASACGGVAAGGSRQRRVPVGDRRRGGGRSPRRGATSGALHGEDVLRSAGVATGGRGRCPGARRRAVSLAWGRRGGDRRPVPEPRGRGVGTGGAEEHGCLELRRAAAARRHGEHADDPLHRAPGTREPCRGLLEGARGRTEAHRGRGAQPRADQRKTKDLQGMTRAMRLLAATIFVLAAPRLLSAQERGAVALGEAVAGLDVTTRVLLIGAHPDDEDTQLLTWLARGRQVETAYLSLTRGDGGQNLIGNELG